MFKLTEKEKKEYKEKYKEIYEITVDDKACIVRKPNRKDLSYAMQASNGGKDAVKLQEALFNNCFIAGDEEFKVDDALFFAAGAKLSELMEIKEAEIKKL